MMTSTEAPGAAREAWRRHQRSEKPAVDSSPNEWRLEPCHRCGHLVWDDPDARLLAEIAGEEWQPKCWNLCTSEKTIGSDIDGRTPRWARPTARSKPRPGGGGSHNFGFASGVTRIPDGKPPYGRWDWWWASRH